MRLCFRICLDTCYTELHEDAFEGSTEELKSALNLSERTQETLLQLKGILQISSLRHCTGLNNWQYYGPRFLANNLQRPWFHGCSTTVFVRREHWLAQDCNLLQTSDLSHANVCFFSCFVHGFVALPRSSD